MTREARALVARCAQTPGDADMTQRLLYWDGEWHAAVQMWGAALIKQAQDQRPERATARDRKAHEPWCAGKGALVCQLVRGGLPLSRLGRRAACC